MSVADILERIRGRMAAVEPGAPRKCTGRVLINLSNGVQWTMDLTGLQLVEGDCSEPDATFTMDDDTFVALGNRQLDIAEAKASGRVQVTGDAELLSALRVCSEQD